MFYNVWHCFIISSAVSHSFMQALRSDWDQRRRKESFWILLWGSNGLEDQTKEEIFSEKDFEHFKNDEIEIN